MNFAQFTLSDFARQLGMDELTLNDQGVASLVFESLGTLFVEQLDGSVLIYLVLKHERLEQGMLEQALFQCHWQNNQPLELNAALVGERSLAISTRIEDSKFNLPTLEQALQLLSQLHDQILSGAAV